MRISVFGLGYVGVVSVACLLRDGHEITGIDTVRSKVADLAKGKSPVKERGVAKLLAQGLKAGRLRSSVRPVDGVLGVDMLWICVGTPASCESGIDLSIVEGVVREIGEAIKECDSRPLVVLRSTVLPGTMEELVVPVLEESSGLKVGEEIDVVYHPEFLRESSAVADFDSPPKIVVGEISAGSGDKLISLYNDIDAPVFRVKPAEAEMVKYCDNLFHAVKVTFANEVGAVAHSANIDARTVAEIFCSDVKLNLSEKYLRPGFAYGGSCLPKDLRAMLRYSTLHSIPTPMLNGVLESNIKQVENLLKRILDYNPQRVGMVGLAFKANTDDMRESPYVAIAKALIGEGVDVLIHDSSIKVLELNGCNRELVEKALGHLQKLMVDSQDSLADADLILINHNTVDAATVCAWLGRGIRVIDLVGVAGIDRNTIGYEGVAW